MFRSVCHSKICWLRVRISWSCYLCTSLCRAALGRVVGTSECQAAARRLLELRLAIRLREREKGCQIADMLFFVLFVRAGWVYFVRCVK